ncbi:hypothetical protein Tco_0247450 [Tanacetum coccineum]
MILNSLQNGPLVWPTVVEEDGTTRTKKYKELSVAEKLQADCDLKATNIVLQGLPLDVYAIVNHHKVSKEIWDRVKLLMQGTKLSLQEKECKLYDEFDKFSFVKGETLYHLPPEWSKFVTDVKLARDLHTTNYDQLYSYLEQHEAHANETRLMRERYQYPLAFSHQTSSVPLTAYNSPQSSTQPLTEFPQMDSGLVVPVFNQGDDPIACLNKAMTFLTAVASSRFPSTNNQLRTSSNSRNQSTIQDDKVTMQQVQGRQGQSYAGNSYKGDATSSGGNNAGGQGGEDWLTGSNPTPLGLLERQGCRVHIGKLKLLNDFYVINMKMDPKTPLLVGRGFLANANAVIDYRMAKIAVGEGITRKDFLDYHLPREWGISRDAELNPFKDTLVFRRMVEFLGAIPIKLKLYLMRKKLEVLRKFIGLIIGDGIF